MNIIPIYFENLTFLSLLLTLLFNSHLRQLFVSESSNIYYIDSSVFMKRVIIPILKKCKFRIECLKFQMIDIKDERGELIRYRIPRKDLFLIQDKIINSEEYKSLHHETWNQGRISNFLTKGIANDSIMDEKSAARIMFVIQVLHWHMQKNVYDKSIFVINKRPWFSIYNE